MIKKIMNTIIPTNEHSKNIYFLNPINGKYKKNNNLMNKLFILTEETLKKFDVIISNTQIDIQVKLFELKFI